MRKDCPFTSEAALVEAFCAWVQGKGARRRDQTWTIYHETAGWDLLLVDNYGVQLGIEAKLTLNAKVIEQALPGYWFADDGPDYRAVLVPSAGLQHHLKTIAEHLGIVVISLHDRGYRSSRPEWWPTPELPDQANYWSCSHWPGWVPGRRCQLPDYVPDVVGGKAAPVALTRWKIQAIKLLILLERTGSVTRTDMKELKLSPTRWTALSMGYLDRTPTGYVKSDRTPDLRAQHPRNWAEIEDDYDTWAPMIRGGLPA